MTVLDKKKLRKVHRYTRLIGNSQARLEEFHDKQDSDNVVKEAGKIAKLAKKVVQAYSELEEDCIVQEQLEWQRRTR